MKILHIENIANVAYNLCSYMYSQGLDVSLLSHNPTAGIFDLANIKNEKWIKNVRSSNPCIVQYNYFREILKDQADIIHTHWPFHQTSFAIASRFIGKSSKVIVHCHGNDLRSGLYMPKFGWLIRTNLELADQVLVSTPDLLKNWKKAEFLPNPIDTDRFKPSASPLDLHNGHDYVIFAPARHVWRDKRQDIFLYALRGLIDAGYDCNMLMVEAGQDLPRSKNLIETLNLRKNVKFLKIINPEEMTDYYNASDVVFDGMGNHIMGLVSLEALACNKPVLSDFKYNDAYSIAPPIDRVICINDVINKTERRLGSSRWYNFREWILKTHSYHVIVPRLLKVYEGLVCGQGALNSIH